ncbi:STAS domain-containing protein [Streptomyces sp. NPDC005548]|uniref:STAS domain-containing protein n=1 Tax=Streptomyces sp. NPDC005548 TaxID=3364724 RepID=UPI003699B7B1
MYNTAAEHSIRLPIAQNVRAGVRVLALSGEIDADNVRLLREALRVNSHESAKVVLDLSAITFMDSSAISVLAGARRDAVAAGGWIRMAALSTPVQRVVEIVGLDTIIVCYSTLAEALADTV